MLRNVAFRSGMQTKETPAPPRRNSYSCSHDGPDTRCVWLSTNPGMTTRPVALISSASRATIRFSTRRVGPASLTYRIAGSMDAEVILWEELT